MFIMTTTTETKTTNDTHDTTPQRSDTRSRNITDYAALTTDENDTLRHVSMWGSDGYPVSRQGRRWTARPFPVLFATKREAVAAFERYLDSLRARITEAR